MLKSLKNEIKKVGSLSLFFAIGYGYLLLLMKLFIKEETAVDVTIFGQILIYALISVKSVAIMDMTTWLNRFTEAARYLRVLYKTLVYSFGAFVLISIENFFHVFHTAKAFGPAIILFLETRNLYRFLGILLGVSIIFLVHNIFQELDRYLGRGSLSKIFFDSPQ
jgi:hypothetical protein